MGGRGSTKSTLSQNRPYSSNNTVSQESLDVCHLTQISLMSKDYQNWNMYLLDCLHPSGGYSQWQSRTVARREGKRRAPTTNQNTYMVSRPEVARRTDRERNDRVNKIS